MRRGLIKHELAIKDLLVSEKLDILFLVETGFNSIKSNTEYIINGYETILQLTDEKCSKVRIMALVSNDINQDMVVLKEIMTPQFPSIWLEFSPTKENKVTIGGFYREWTHNGIKSTEEQVKCMELFSKQIETVCKISKKVINVY